MTSLDSAKLNGDIKTLLAQFDAFGDLNQNEQKRMVKAAKAAGEIYRVGVVSEIKNADQIWKIPRGNKTFLTYPGQLKKSIKIWKVKSSKFTVFIGVKRKIASDADGWFAWIVNYGHTGGTDAYDGHNKNFWDRGREKVAGAANIAYRELLMKEMNKHTERIAKIK